MSSRLAIGERAEARRRASADAAPPSPEPERSRQARSRVPVIARRLAVALVGVVLAAAAARLVVAPGTFALSPAGTTQYRPDLVALIVVALLGGITAAGLVPRRARAMRLGPRIAIVGVVTVLTVALQLRLAWAVLQYGTFDSMQIFTAAYRATVGPVPGLFSAADNAAYFAMLPNNALLAASWTPLFAVMHAIGVVGPQSYLWATVVVNCLVIDLTVVLTWYVAARIGTPFSRRVTLAGAFATMVVSPWLDVPYSDTLGFGFPIGLLALFLAWSGRRSLRARLALWLLIGGITAVGLGVKPTVIFAAIALLLAEVVLMDARGRARLLAGAATAAVFGVTLLAGHLATGSVIDATHVLPFAQSANRGALPFTHFMAMGATGDGGYNQGDVDASLATPSAQRSGADLARYLDRVAGMGPIGYPVFLGEKLIYLVSDGTFFQGREGLGPFPRPFVEADHLGVIAQSVYPLGAPLHWLLSSAWQGVWIVVVALCLVPLRGMTGERRVLVAATRLAVLLMIAFLMLSESRSRYLYLYLPFLLVLAGLGADALRRTAPRLLEAVRRRRTPTEVLP